MNSEELNQLRAAGCDLSDAISKKRELEKQRQDLMRSLNDASNRIDAAKKRLLKLVGVGSNLPQRVLHLDSGICIVLRFSPRPVHDDNTPYGEDRTIVSVGDVNGMEDV